MLVLHFSFMWIIGVRVICYNFNSLSKEILTSIRHTLCELGKKQLVLQLQKLSSAITYLHMPYTSIYGSE
ncbi:hypothetical protein PVAP13_7KG209455 [Panicum virgatum]|uniref:Uncharacterized protein n=1 Tax=Panicum virgatum TaxID=38727 RepID=A0A8T0QNL9_PANVG|nr:hypothetical protein PVAP13_7KG209455 [Panicum virgatum]